MNSYFITYPILVPVAAALFIAIFLRRHSRLANIFAVVSFAACAFLEASLYGKNLILNIPWAEWGFQISLRSTQFGVFIGTSAAVLALLVSIYSTAFFKGERKGTFFQIYLLITAGFINAVTSADNILVLLFFWEGQLAMLFGMILLGGVSSFRTAVKAFVISSVADLCMMVGIILTIMISGTQTISAMNISLTSGVTYAAFVLLFIGASAKGGAIPFQTWIPDAARDAPLPFMAIIPGAIEKLLGIYFLTRICVDMFAIDKGSWVSTMMMTVGAVTIVAAVLMALLQKEFKKLLSFHAISQMGYMILGIGTLTPIGIVGGIFHMINNALYKCCLFLTGGVVERQTGTTDLKRISGLMKFMPLTFTGFFIAAISISGFPLTNGFFSKELIYDGCLERGMIFYIAAIVGSFLTAASFLKLGHAAFCGPVKLPRDDVKEAPFLMTMPILVIAAICIFFGVANVIPVNSLIEPVVEAKTGMIFDFGGYHVNFILWGISTLVIAAAIVHHFVFAKRAKAAVYASDHIRNAPVARKIFDMAEVGRFDLYRIGKVFIAALASVFWLTDRANDYVYNRIIPAAAYTGSSVIRKLHNGSHARYLIWSLVGILALLAMISGGV